MVNPSFSTIFLFSWHLPQLQLSTLILPLNTPNSRPHLSACTLPCCNSSAHATFAKLIKKSAAEMGKAGALDTGLGIFHARWVQTSWARSLLGKLSREEHRFIDALIWNALQSHWLITRFNSDASMKSHYKLPFPLITECTRVSDLKKINLFRLPLRRVKGRLIVVWKICQ